jgi:hypothetical protein
MDEEDLEVNIKALYVSAVVLLRTDSDCFYF